MVLESTNVSSIRSDFVIMYGKIKFSSDRRVTISSSRAAKCTIQCTMNTRQTFRLACNVRAYIHLHIPLDRKTYDLKFDNVTSHRNKSQDYCRIRVLGLSSLLQFFINKERIDGPKIPTEYSNGVVYRIVRVDAAT